MSFAGTKMLYDRVGELGGQVMVRDKQLAAYSNSSNGYPGAKYPNLFVFYVRLARALGPFRRFNLAHP